MGVNSGKVSIVVPIYNINNEFLEKCIQTLINQTYKNIEIILINDGSTEENRCICEKYKNLDNRIILFNQENAGVSVARNRGIELATGEWICFVDSDDWVELNMIERLIKCADNKEKDIIICSTYLNFKNKEMKSGVFYKSGKICGKDKKRLLIDTVQKIKDKKSSKRCAVGVPWAKLYNKSFLDKYNLRFIEGMTKAEDVTFNLYAFQNAKWIEIYNDEYVYHYRYNKDSVSNCYSINVEADTKKSIEERENFIKKFYEDDKDFYKVLNMYKIAQINMILKKKYFNDKNSDTKKQKYSSVKRLINEEMYRDAIKNTKIKDCNKYNKLLLFTLKIKNIYLLEKVFLLKKIKDYKKETY